jgi:hypothetical protein
MNFIYQKYGTLNPQILGRPKFVCTKHEVRYRSAHLYLVGFKFDHQNVYNIITTCMFSSIMMRNVGHCEVRLHVYCCVYL